MSIKRNKRKMPKYVKDEFWEKLTDEELKVLIDKDDERIRLLVEKYKKEWE